MLPGVLGGAELPPVENQCLRNSSSVLSAELGRLILAAAEMALAWACRFSGVGVGPAASVGRGRWDRARGLCVTHNWVTRILRKQ